MKKATATALIASILLPCASLAAPPRTNTLMPGTPAQKPAPTSPKKPEKKPEGPGAHPHGHPVGKPSTAKKPAKEEKPKAQDTKARRVLSVEGITQYELANGLKILLFPDPSSATVTVNLTYLVGSRHEGYGETGMAHLLEHLLFKGSKNHPKIPQELSEHGARPNGTTWLDRTNYYETFQASDENLEWALSMEADRMVNSFIAKKDLTSEMTVVRNEFESGENDPSSILSERVTSTAFLWHNYGNPTIGARSDIEKVPIERLQDFYRRYYQPDNAILVVAGKIDEDKTIALIEKHFGPIPRPTRKLIPTYTEEPPQDGERTVTLRRVGDVQMAMTAYHTPPGSHEDFAAVEIMSEVLSDTPSGRMYKALVEPGKAVSVSGGSYQLKEPGLTLFSATVRKDGDLATATNTLVDVVERFGQSPPTNEELERARTGLLKQMELVLNSSERLALQLSEWAAMGDWRHFFLYRDRLEKVTAADVQRVAKKYLLPSNRTLGQFYPSGEVERAQVPWVEDPIAAVRNYQGRPPVKQGEAFDPSPMNVDKRDERSVLPGGLKLAVFPKRTRGETVHFAMTLRLGDKETTKNVGAAPDAVGSMLMRGTTKHTREQLLDRFDKLKAQVSIDTSHDTAIVTVETVKENLPEVLRLVGEVLRQPAFSPKEFATFKQAVVAAAEELKSDPEELADIALNRHLAPYPEGDPRRTETVDELIKTYWKLTLEDVKAYYEKVYGASTGEIAVVGDFEPKDVSKLLGELFSDWKSPVKFQRMPSEYFEVKPTRETIVVKDKANAVLRGGMNLQIKDNDPDYPALMLANYIIGGGFLNSRLATRIRQKEGLSYGVGSSLSAGALDRVGSFGVYAIAAPSNVAKVETAMKEELQKVIQSGFTAEEVEKAKAGYLQSREGTRSRDSYLARTLLRYQFLDRRFTWDEEYENKIRALTPQQLQAAVAKYLSPDKLSFFRSGELTP